MQISSWIISTHTHTHTLPAHKAQSFHLSPALRTLFNPAASFSFSCRVASAPVDPPSLNGCSFRHARRWLSAVALLHCQPPERAHQIKKKQPTYAVLTHLEWFKSPLIKHPARRLFLMTLTPQINPLPAYMNGDEGYIMNWRPLRDRMLTVHLLI